LRQLGSDGMYKPVELQFLRHRIEVILIVKGDLDEEGILEALLSLDLDLRDATSEFIVKLAVYI
jgi:hypothetical protein